jgi:hypothetical protein
MGCGDEADTVSIKKGAAMDRKPIESTNLRSVGYDPGTHILEIEFRGGNVYQYKDVPEAVYHGLVTAPSAGAFFYANIRNEFPATRV